MKHLPRVYQDQLLVLDTPVQIDSRSAHHLAHVLRCAVGDSIILFNGDGHDFLAKLNKVGRTVEAMPFEKQAPRPESPLELHLAQGIMRGDKMDLALQKATELGTQKITPVITERCSLKHKGKHWEKRWEHWQAVIISACEQCGRATLPTLEKPLPLSDWLTEQPIGFVLHPGASQHLPAETPSEKNSLGLLIGPEGGLTDQEVQQAKDTGQQALGLGPRILRAETATIVAITLLQRQWGDLASHS